MEPAGCNAGLKPARGHPERGELLQGDHAVPALGKRRDSQVKGMRSTFRAYIAQKVERLRFSPPRAGGVRR